MHQKSLYFECHSGLDPESSILSWIVASHFRGDKFTPEKAGAGMTGLKTNVKKRWMQHIR